MDPASVRPRVLWIAALLAASSAWPSPGQERDGPAEEQLEDKVEVRLAQIDVSVLGAAEAARRLESSDFELFVGGRRIEDIIVDRFCGCDGVEPGVRLAATYLLYFDQLQLTVEGRQRSIESVRTMIPMLLREGDRAMIASALAAA